MRLSTLMHANSFGARFPGRFAVVTLRSCTTVGKDLMLAAGGEKETSTWLTQQREALLNVHGLSADAGNGEKR